jgi:site-specific DNA-adenine methylase
LNDNNAELINFWYQVQTNRPALEDKLQYVWNGQGFIDLIQQENPTPLNRAVIFYLNNQRGSTVFTRPIQLTKSFTPWQEKMNATRLSLLTKDCLDAMELVHKLHDPHGNRAVDEGRDVCVVFYEDPPYVDSEEVCGGKGFDHVGFAKVNHQYADMGHHILLSYNKCDLVTQLYADWYLEEFECGRIERYGNLRKEFILSNRPLKRYVTAKVADIHRYI